VFSRNEIGGSVDRPTGRRYPWWQLEEFKPDGGMWSIPGTLMRDQHVRNAADLMADPPRFVEAMRRAVHDWPVSCQNALSTPGLNQRAWLGQAGCYLGTGSPEETTKLAWRQLDAGEQFAANQAADTVIAEWRKSQAPDPAQDMLWGSDYA
jgi:hypothetical protein